MFGGLSPLWQSIAAIVIEHELPLMVFHDADDPRILHDSPDGCVCPRAACSCWDSEAVEAACNRFKSDLFLLIELEHPLNDCHLLRMDRTPRSALRIFDGLIAVADFTSGVRPLLK